MRKLKRPSGLFIGYCIVVAGMLYSTALRLDWCHGHGGVTVGAIARALFGLALGLWMTTACYRGRRWAAAILAGLASIGLVGGAVWIALGNGYSVSSNVVFVVNALAWLILGTATLRATRAEFLAKKDDS